MEGRFWGGFDQKSLLTCLKFIDNKKLKLRSMKWMMTAILCALSLDYNKAAKLADI